jgi:ligand-binding sensor domain-containing protein/DNA-binding CsgD family transcriptional regulator
MYAGAQEVPRTLNFTKNDYRAQNQMWSIVQTPQYEMFFGNNDGLISFNGSFWQTLQLPQKPIVRSVASDAMGRVFVGGFAEFGFFERDEFGNFQYHSLSKDVRFEKVKREEIWHILVHNQAVYFQSFSTIYKYDYKDVTVLSPPSNIMFLKAANNRLWIQGLSKGLYELKDDNLFQFIEQSTFLANKTVSTILPYSKGLLIGTAKDGIFKYENERFSEWQSSAQSISKEFELNKGIQLSNGNYAFGTILNGVYIVKPDGSTLYHINKENGLQNNTVIALHEDLAHNLWLGLDKGVDLIELNSPLTFFQDKTGKLGAVYAAVLYNKKLYVGTNQGLFYRNIDKNTEEPSFNLLKGTQGQVWDLKVMDGQLFCGHNAGTFIIDNNNSILKISDITGGWYLIRHPTRNDLLYQATYTGIILFKKNQQNQWRFHKNLNGLGAPIRKIIFDEKDILWAMTAQNQLYKFKLDASGEHTDITSGTHEGIELMTLPKGSIMAFSEIGKQLLFSTDSASFVFKDNAFVETQEMNGVGLGHFILKKGLNQDVFKIYKNYVEIVKGTSTTRLGLKLIPQYEEVIVLDSTHYLFGLDDGYAILNRNNLQTAQTRNPKTLVSLHTKDGKVFPFYTGDNLKTKLTLPPQYRAFRMDFALPYFLENAQFQYKNNNQEWSNFSESPSSEFSNLLAGEQVFKVKNNITNEETTITFAIKPYWYETIWAKVLYFLAFLGLLFLLQKYHHHQLERQRLKLELEKQREIEQHRIAADNEKLHADIINKSKDLANSTMSIIQKNEILMDIKEELGNLKTASRDSLSDKHYRHLQHLIDINLTHEESQKVFEDNFNTVHEDFLKRLKHQHSDLTAGDLKLAAYLRMNLSSKEISPLLFISVRSIENKRSRLRKKMGLNDSDNLTEYLIQF